jgi:Uma2 family endonuclease
MHRELPPSALNDDSSLPTCMSAPRRRQCSAAPDPRRSARTEPAWSRADGRAELDRACDTRRVTVSVPLHRYTYREYLALEESANVRHEFFDGEIYAMAGGTPEHAAICANVTTSLNVQLRGKGCRVHSSDLRIRVLETGLATYPDVTVVCRQAELDPENRQTITNPTVLVEVLSPSTAAFDRGEKLSHYKRIGSLREIVLVAHDERLVEVWRREASGSWARGEARSGSVTLDSIGCVLELEDVFRDELAAR